MIHGFIKVAAATPSVKVADTSFNTSRILDLFEMASEKGVHLLVLPELCVTSCTAGDLFHQQALLDSAREAVNSIANGTPKNMVAVYGAPLEVSGKVYNCSFVSCGGELLGIVPKSNLSPAEKRWFAEAPEEETAVQIGDFIVPMGSTLLFKNNQVSSFVLGCSSGLSDLDGVLTECGATVLACPETCDDYAGKLKKVAGSLAHESSRLFTSYVFSGAGDGESTTDLVYSGFNIITELGEVLACTSRNEDSLLISEIDTQKICSERRRSGRVYSEPVNDFIEFNLENGQTELTRHITRTPYLPEKASEKAEACAEVLDLQARGLRRRLEHTRTKTAILGISGGLDSTLALLATVKAFEDMGMNKRNIFGISMPCFGTTHRTRSNAEALVQSLGCSFMEIDITDAVRQHFKDIEQSETDYNTTFENSQARERTQILMDLANKYNGLVVGTGDISELALGWATYNGDHMSMYGVNAGVPKTVAREVTAYYAQNLASESTRETLKSILDTPISPELIPGKQETENIVGPYELHDFFLYHLVRYSCSPSKIYRMAVHAFSGRFNEQTIALWLKTFIRRFFNQQFKRSCMPDGPKVCEISLSPRGAWSMPSDSISHIWLEELEKYLNFS
ncbi:MAG: NAD(+) synthase [Sphaerochaetaceae bacterium]|nr:NAD(+) synthase [Sphaerochaetaceae bacterium]